MHDRAVLRQILSRGMSANLRNSGQKLEIFEDRTGDFAASLSNEFIVIGSPADVRRYSELRDGATLMRAENLRRMTYFLSSPASGNVVTYTDRNATLFNNGNDSLRARNRKNYEIAIGSIQYPRAFAVSPTTRPLIDLSQLAVRHSQS